MVSLFKKLRSFLGSAWRGLRVLPKLRSRHLPQILESFTKKDLAAVAAFALILALSGTYLIRAEFFGSSSGIPDYGGEHVEGLIGQPRFINPVLAASSSVDSDLSRLVYAPLLQFDQNLNLVPALADALPQISADQKTYTLKLKSNLKWQDGQPINADDIVYTIETIQDPDYESPLAANWERVKIEKIDDLTVQFTLHEVSASFISNFTLGILPKHVWSSLSPNSFRLASQNLQPVGSGPYAVHEIKKTSDGKITAITLMANSNFYDGTPYITYFTFKFYDDETSLSSAYQAKDIQAIGFVPFDSKTFVQDGNRASQYQINLPQYQAVFFNLPKNSILGDLSVRQALWLATDRAPIIDQVYLGLAKPAYGPILPGNLGYSDAAKNAAHTSVGEAAGILDKAGWILDPSTNTRYKMVTTGTGTSKTQTRVNLEFNLATSVSPLNVKTAEILEQQWAQIGATVHSVVVSASDLQDNYIRPRNFDALLFSENTGPDPDPFPFWASSQAHDPGLNLSGFSDATVDKLLTDARQTNDTNVRAQDYQQFQDIINQQIPAIFLDSAQYVYTLPKKEQGFELTTMIYPSERFLDVQHWYIETKRK